MTKKQLQYIKDKQKENTYVLPTIKMRENISNSIIEELEVIYSPDLTQMETEFKTSLNDVSLSNDFLDDTRMIKLIREYGTDVVLIYMYLHTKMCKMGYRIIWDDMQQDVLCATLCGVYKVPIENINNIINALIQNKLLFLISDGKENWLTSSYQIYMFERVSAKRVRDRIYKRNQSIKKDEKIKIETNLPKFDNEDEFAGISSEAFMNEEIF